MRVGLFAGLLLALVAAGAANARGYGYHAPRSPKPPHIKAIRPPKAPRIKPIKAPRLPGWGHSSRAKHRAENRERMGD